MNIFNKIYFFVWDEGFWLGKYSWTDLISKSPDIYYPRFGDLNLSIFLAIALILVRWLYTRFIVVPFANAIGLYEQKHRRVNASPLLEAAFTKYNQRIPFDEMEKLSSGLDMSQRQIERWLYRRYLQAKPSAMHRFKESSWEFLLNASAFFFGAWALHDKTWLWDTSLCWANWPYQHVESEIFGVYIFQLGFFWHLLYRMVFKRDYLKKDRKEMMLHHVLTISLIYISWVSNFVRIGCLVLVLHNIADPFLACGKMALVSKHSSVVEVFFKIFVVVWIMTRCVLYPFWVLRACLFDRPDYGQLFSVPNVCNLMLCSLQVLHLVWTYMILSAAFQKVQRGALRKDVRSESEEPEEDTNDEVGSSCLKKTAANGNVPHYRLTQPPPPTAE